MSTPSPLSRDAERQAAHARRLEADDRRRERVKAAQDRVRSFAGEHVDVCAMALLTLEWMGRPATQRAVKDRVHSQYSWLFDGESEAA
jgi:hypothetical protein